MILYLNKGDHNRMREFTVIIEQDEDGIYIASVPELPGCHTQAETLDELNRRIKEAIELYLEIEAEAGDEKHLDFIGIQKVKVEI
jgi:predicted RNase H-like HicB family nuclease